MSRSPDSPWHRAGADRFATTRWTVVLAAGRDDATNSREALAALCALYWYPLYAFVRRSGYATAEAEDLTQSFFAQLLAKNYVGQADRARGKFRSFLLASIQHFLANRRDYEQAQKRGGGAAHFSLDCAEGETKYAREPAHDLTPERLFEQQWALALLERALAAVREQYTAGGKQSLFEALKPCLTAGSDRVDYQELAVETGLSTAAAKVAVHRLRRRFRERLRQEVSATVDGDKQVDEEIRELFAVFAR